MKVTCSQTLAVCTVSAGFVGTSAPNLPHSIHVPKKKNIPRLLYSVKNCFLGPFVDLVDGVEGVYWLWSSDYIQAANLPYLESDFAQVLYGLCRLRFVVVLVRFHEHPMESRIKG